jgi:Subtilase family
MSMYEAHPPPTGPGGLPQPAYAAGWPPRSARPPGAGEIVFAALIGAWIIVTTALVQVATWAIEQLQLIEGGSFSHWAWPVAVWVNAILAGVPAILLATLAKRATLRATGIAWTLAALLLGVVGSARAVPSQQNEIYLTVLTVLAAVCASGLRLRNRGGSDQSVGLLLASAGGIAVLVPWLWVGALGGPIETALALLAAAACGWLAAELLRGVWAAFGELSATVGNVLLAGLVGSVALVPLAAAFGGSGPHLAQMLFVPPLAFVAAAIAHTKASGADLKHSREVVPITGGLATGALIGFAVLGPLAFIEPDETSILLGLHDVGFWAVIGALCSLGIAVALGIAGIIGTRLAQRTAVHSERNWRRFAAPTALVAAVATAVVVYPLAGHPGFFGENLFVIMKTQASLTGLDQIPDLGQRRAETYQRLITTANTTQAPLRAKLRDDGIKFTPYYLVNGILVDDGSQARIWLSRRSDVDRVLLNPRLRPIPSAEAPMRGDAPAPTGPQWNISLINAPAVWATGDTGAGIVIGGSDTGVDLQHPALTASYRGGPDSWFDPWNHTRSPVDHNGHGTHTMGSALGAGGIGVAPGAQWMACVNLDRNMGNPAYYLDCLQFMMAPFATGGKAFAGNPARAADVLTNSWGCPTLEGCDRTALQPAVDALTAAGIFFVAAAGNEGPRCSSIDDAPAPYAASFTVGAVDRSGKVASFSSRGSVAGETKPDLVAPGVGVVSALPGGGYGALDGTSMATPQVAGVVALMWSASPALRGNVSLTAQILRQTTDPATPAGDGGGCGGAQQVGAGLVNASAAVAAATSA